MQKQSRWPILSILTFGLYKRACRNTRSRKTFLGHSFPVPKVKFWFSDLTAVSSEKLYQQHLWSCGVPGFLSPPSFIKCSWKSKSWAVLSHSASRCLICPNVLPKSASLSAGASQLILHTFLKNRILWSHAIKITDLVGEIGVRTDNSKAVELCNLSSLDKKSSVVKSPLGLYPESQSGWFFASLDLGFMLPL